MTASGKRSRLFWAVGHRRLMAQPSIEFNHALIYTRDVEKAVGFYADLLGFETIEMQAPSYARLRSPKGRQTIGLHAVRDGQALDSRMEGVRLYFEVRDLDALCERLAAKGVRFSQMPKDMEWGWRHAYLTDPDGHELSLYWAGERRLRRA